VYQSLKTQKERFQTYKGADDNDEKEQQKLVRKYTPPRSFLSITLPCPKTQEIEGVDLQEDHPLKKHFAMLIIGKPGSGKTLLAKELCTN